MNTMFNKVKTFFLRYFLVVDPQVKRQQALLASAEKWSINAEANRFSETTIVRSACPCCEIWWKKLCKGCPVSAFTKIHSCRMTPFVQAKEHYNKRNLKQFKKAARAELKFLLALVYGNYEEAERLCKKYR